MKRTTAALFAATLAAQPATAKETDMTAALNRPGFAEG